MKRCPRMFTVMAEVLCAEIHTRFDVATTREQCEEIVREVMKQSAVTGAQVLRSAQEKHP